MAFSLKLLYFSQKLSLPFLTETFTGKQPSIYSSQLLTFTMLPQAHKIPAVSQRIGLAGKMYWSSVDSGINNSPPISLVIYLCGLLEGYLTQLLHAIQESKILSGKVLSITRFICTYVCIPVLVYLIPWFIMEILL